MKENTAFKSLIKVTEAETLATFKEEIPSQYFSHLDEKEYARYVSHAEYIYRDHFKFPPQMFRNIDLIDFGAGTGENTIYLANWGARCTLVEMNEDAQKISKEVFKKYVKNFNDHRFIHSSIFDYVPSDNVLYDIVHCRGVLSHTAAKEVAFQKIATFVKPGGFLIFGDPNKAGGFQNMLQRYAVYKLASTPNEMVDVSEALFKEDIDRSEKAIPRTRRAIIFDRWVIQSQDDPSISQVFSWAIKSGLRLYSVYPPVIAPLLGDSVHHFPKLDPYIFENLFSLAEASWMTQTISDEVNLRVVNEAAGDFASALTELTSYVANFNKNSKIDIDKFDTLSNSFVSSVKSCDFMLPLKNKFLKFMREAVDFVKLVKKGDIKQIRTFIVSAEHLFRGACGVRHVDFVAYKPQEKL